MGVGAQEALSSHSDTTLPVRNSAASLQAPAVSPGILLAWLPHAETTENDMALVPSHLKTE